MCVQEAPQCDDDDLCATPTSDVHSSLQWPVLDMLAVCTLGQRLLHAMQWSTALNSAI